MLENETARSAAAKPQGKAEPAPRAKKKNVTTPATRTAARRRSENMHEHIQRRAYELWESEGRPAGREHAHWLQAEQELGKGLAASSDGKAASRNGAGRARRASGAKAPRAAAPGAAGELKLGEPVFDKDLAMVVNGLRASGSDAISINDERITPLSAVRRVEDVILVNRRPVAPPYEVRAIGDPRTLSVDFVNGSGGAWLRTANAQGGIRFDVFTSESLTLPSGNASLDYAQLKETS
jgi:hypothetical protein